MGTGAVIRDTMFKATPGGDNLIPPSTFLGILPPEMWNKPKRLFAVPFTILNQLSTTSRSAQFQADIDNDYVFYYGAYICRSVDNQTVINQPPLLVDMATTGNQQSYNPPQLSNDIENIFGSAKQPSVWAMPLILPVGQTLIMNVQSLFAATAFNLRITLMGFRVARTVR